MFGKFILIKTIYQGATLSLWGKQSIVEEMCQVETDRWRREMVRGGHFLFAESWCFSIYTTKNAFNFAFHYLFI